MEIGLIGRKDVYDALSKDQRGRLRSLVASMDLSFEIVETRHPDAAELYAVLSLFPAGLPHEVALEVAGCMESLSLDHLYRYHLAAWQNERMFYPVPLHWYAERIRKNREIEERPYMQRALNAFAAYAGECDHRITHGEIASGVEKLLAEETSLRILAQWAAKNGESAAEGSQTAQMASSAANGLKHADRLDTLRILAETGKFLARQKGDRLGEANCLKSLGDLRMREDDLSGARKDYELALPICREIRDRLGEANCLQSQGRLMLMNGNSEEAFQRFRNMLNLYAGIGSLQGQQNAFYLLATTAQTAGQPDQALLLAEDSLEIGRKIPDKYTQMLNLQLQMQIWRAAENIPAFAASMILIRDLMKSIGNPQFQHYHAAISQMQAAMPNESFEQIARNAEAVRTAAVEDARKRFSQTGQDLPEPGGE